MLVSWRHHSRWPSFECSQHEIHRLFWSFVLQLRRVAHLIQAYVQLAKRKYCILAKICACVLCGFAVNSENLNWSWSMFHVGWRPCSSVVLPPCVCCDPLFPLYHTKASRKYRIMATLFCSEKCFATLKEFFVGVQEASFHLNERKKNKKRNMDNGANLEQWWPFLFFWHLCTWVLMTLCFSFDNRDKVSVQEHIYLPFHILSQEGCHSVDKFCDGKLHLFIPMWHNHHL